MRLTCAAETGRASADPTVAAGRAFTLLDLLVVIGIVGLLAGLLLPALTRAKVRAQGMGCLSNTRQLGLAWLMYADDHNGRLPYNLGGVSGRRIAPRAYTANWVNGILDWERSPDNTNTVLIRAAGLASYASEAVNLYRCPADRVLSSVQRRLGWERRARSYSMNAMMGDAGRATRYGYNVNNPEYQQFFTLGSVPQPQGIFVFLDEHPDSINDGYFINNGETPEWLDLPASYHNGAASFSFADGHSELHRWRCATTLAPARPDAALLPLALAPDQRTDFDWVSEHMSVDLPYATTATVSGHRPRGPRGLRRHRARDIVQALPGRVSPPECRSCLRDSNSPSPTC